MKPIHINIKSIITFVFTLSLFVACTDDDGNLIIQNLLDQHKSNLQNISVDGDNIAYLEYGSGDNVLILLHGIPTSSFLYRDVAPMIAEKTGFRVIALDMLGYGQSDKPIRAGAYSPQAQAARIYSFATALGVEEFVLGLHDVGGLIGWAMFLNDELSRVRGVVVANASPALANAQGELEGVTPAPLTLEILTGEKTSREQWSQLDDSNFARQATIEFLEIGFLDDNLITEELLDAYTEPIANGAAENFVQFFETFGGIFAEGATLQTIFSEFDKPVGLVWGKDDAFFNVEVVPVNLQNQFSVPDRLFTTIEGAGHYVQEEKPDEYAQAISDFINNQF
ncbi:MAG: alpha/beta hydrolase [Bacteroidota bacterium]